MFFFDVFPNQTVLRGADYPLDLPWGVFPNKTKFFPLLVRLYTSHWNTSNFTLEQIKFHNGTNPIAHWNKSSFTLEQIQFHIGTNPISLWNKSNFTCERIIGDFRIMGDF